MRSRNNYTGGFGSAHDHEARPNRIGNHNTARGMVHRTVGIGKQRNSGKSIEFLARQRDRAFNRYITERISVLDSEVLEANARGVSESERNQFALRSAWLGDALAFGRRG